MIAHFFKWHETAICHKVDKTKAGTEGLKGYSALLLCTSKQYNVWSHEFLGCMFCDKCEIADDAIMYFVLINVVVIEDTTTNLQPFEKCF